MTIKQKTRAEQMEELGKFLGKKFTFVRTLGEELKIQRELNKFTSQLDSNQQQATLSIASPPQLLMTNEVKKIYQSNNWSAIKKLQDQANKDLSAMMSNIQNHPLNSWFEVQDDTDPTQYYYYTFDKINGSYAWCWCNAVNPAFDPFNPNIKLMAPVQYGVYSTTTSIAGIHSYNLGLATVLPEVAVASILSLFISKALGKGINFLASDLTKMISDAATEAGCELVFSIASSALGIVCGCVVFAIVFIGISYLWNFFNKRFQIYVSVYNWDPVNDWQIPVQALSNGVNPGQDSNNNINLQIPKQVPQGSHIGKSVSLPPDIASELMHTMEAVVNYATIAYENTHTFAQGLSFSFNCSMVKNPNTGFTYAFQCPWVASNAQYIEGTVQDPNSFLSKARSHWVEKTGPLTVNVAGMPVSCWIDDLTGGDAQGSDNYQVAIHINPPQN
ncbi:hypothetical protein CYY_006131 [Polysphondylium violaceum]|uniref:Uncharacterized protein n=1 Tax=Polysphondylium violaceum TaxID=133409 RepID=A0A8J4URQ1_9MYCE|nr:hypothetical protein CYY_006131 [Polysphondylium violaceum]